MVRVYGELDICGNSFLDNTGVGFIVPRFPAEWANIVKRNRLSGKKSIYDYLQNANWIRNITYQLVYRILPPKVTSEHVSATI